MRPNLKRFSKILNIVFEEDNDPKGISIKFDSNFIAIFIALSGFSQKKTSPAVKNNQIYTLLSTETTILADRCNFSDKDGLDFTFIWIHDREDRRGRIRDG